MSKRIVLTVLVAAVALLSGTGAQAAPDRTGTVAKGAPYAWQGGTGTGTNYYYWDPVGAGNVGPVEHTRCTKDAYSYCEQVLLDLSNPITEEEVKAGITFKEATATIVLNTFTPTNGPVTDFDLLVYESDPQGNRGALLRSDGNLTNQAQERVTFPVTTFVDQPSLWVLVDVVYYQVVDGSYKGTATLT